VDYGDFDMIDAKDSEDSLKDAETIHPFLKQTHALNKKPTNLSADGLSS